MSIFHTIFLFLALTVIGSCNSVEADTIDKPSSIMELNDFLWVLGEWNDSITFSFQNKQIIELWELKGDSLIGEGWNKRDSVSKHIEDLSLVKKDSLFVYHVHVLSSNKHLDFVSDSLGEGYIKFSNFLNDFPQEIEYQKITSDSLTITLYGLAQGVTPQKVVFKMKKSK